MPKRTFQPNRRRRSKTHGFRVRMRTQVGRALGGAVMRNRIRRRMRAAVRKQLAKLRQPVDVVFNPRKSAAEMDFGALTNEIGQAFAAITAGRNSTRSAKQ